MTQKEFETTWLYKRLKPKSHYQIPDNEYFVTGAMLGDPTKFAIMAVDYNKENKHFFSFDLTQEEVGLLGERFDIVGDYDNIEWEILFTIKEGGLVDSVCFTNGARTYDSPILKDMDLGLSVGTKIYDVCWRSTTGEQIRKFIDLIPEDSIKSEDEIHQQFKNATYSYIKVGYHFMSFEDLYKLNSAIKNNQESL